MFSIRSGLVVLAAISSASATIAQGWSLQSSSSETSLHSCGNGAYCPISLHCDTMVGNHEVAACCSSTNDCRGDVEGAPICADDSWSMYTGYDGNGFCCQTGLIGVYDIGKSVAGTCVAAGNVGSSTKAQLKTPGTGSSDSSAASSTTVSTAPAGTTTAGTSGTSSAVVVVSGATTVPSSSGASATTKSTLSSTTVAVVPSKTGASSTNTTSAAAGTSSTAGSSAGVRTTAGFSLMAVAFVAIAML